MRDHVSHPYKTKGKNNGSVYINPLSPELNPICYLLALLSHDLLHVSGIRVKSLTLRLLMSYIYIYIYIYIYGAPILDVSRSHTTMQHSQ
jgi:transposase